MRTAASLLIPLLATSCATARTHPSEHPVQASPSSPTLDGTLDPAEWVEAQVVTASGGRILLRRAGEVLQLAVDGGGRGIASVLVAEGDRVRVLHASAALGTAVYARQGGAWRRIADFVYAARDPDDEAARSRFRAEHGWLSNVARGGADREFVIEGLGEARIAVGHLEFGAEGMRLWTWPEGLADGATSLPLHQGAAPEVLELEPSRWHLVSGASR